MSRDFAHKPRRKSNTESSRIPGWVWLFTLTVAVCFVGFLYFLSQVPEEDGGAEAVRKQFQIALEKEEKQANDTPAEPTEKHETIEDIKEKAETLKKAFEFYELLENDVVAIDLPGDQIDPPATSTTSKPTNTTQTQVAMKDKSWIIQVASFSNVADADRVRAQLILNGLPDTEIISVDVSGKGTYHRVMVGPFSHRPSLNRAQDILAELNFQPLVKAQ